MVRLGNPGLVQWKAVAEFDSRLVSADL